MRSSPALMTVLTAGAVSCFAAATLTAGDACAQVRALDDQPEEDYRQPANSRGPKSKPDDKKGQPRGQPGDQPRGKSRDKSRDKRSNSKDRPEENQAQEPNAQPKNLLLDQLIDSSAFDALPDSLQLTGIVRDFHIKNKNPGGHPDFEQKPGKGFGQYLRIAGPELDEEGKPVFFSKGYKRMKHWRDQQNQNIMAPLDHYPSLPTDKLGSMQPLQGDAVTSAESFSQWFRDIPGVNVSKPVTLTLYRQPLSNVYTFDDELDPLYADLGGFFPINNDLFGNTLQDDINFHFTYEIDAQFVYEAGTNQTFRFRGDDDVFVFVDGKLVIDIGGIHSPVGQIINLDRLDWLQDGQTYGLKFFYAERFRHDANFRIETSIILQTVDLPTITALHD
ncbi:MAG: fibro-slime domain-containing protein [Planctomycetota bacterium]